MMLSAAAAVEDCKNCTICKGADHFLEKHYLHMKVCFVKFLEEDRDLFDLCRTLATLLIGLTVNYITVRQLSSGFNNMIAGMKPHLLTNFAVHAGVMAMCWIDIYHPHYDYTKRSEFMESLQLITLDYVHHDRQPFDQNCQNCGNAKCRGQHELDHKRASRMCQEVCDTLDCACARHDGLWT